MVLLLVKADEGVWEIDDDTLAKHCEQLEAQGVIVSSSHIDLDVDYVPETQFDPIPVQTEARTSTLHSSLRQVVSNQTPWHQPIFESNILIPLHPVPPAMPRGERSYPNCDCGAMCIVVVSKKERNAGRRFFCCSSFHESQLNPGEVGHCNHFKWIDKPLCERGVEYAHEVQGEIRRLEHVIKELKGSTGRWPSYR